MPDSPPLKVLLVGVGADDLDRLRRALADRPAIAAAGAMPLARYRAGAARPPHDLAVLTPEALERFATPTAGNPPAAAERDDPPIETLTAREQQVLAHAADGLSNREIADALGISEHTVKFHLASIYGKLGVANRTEAVQHALRLGILVI